MRSKIPRTFTFPGGYKIKVVRLSDIEADDLMGCDTYAEWHVGTREIYLRKSRTGFDLDSDFAHELQHAETDYGDWFLGRTEAHKDCARCLQSKPLASFSFNKKTDSFSSWCTSCHAEGNKALKRKMPVSVRVFKMHKAHNPSSLLRQQDVVVPLVCPVLGIPIEQDLTARTDNSPSIDRIDSSKGYIPGNVIVVSWRANRLKQDASVLEIKQLANFYGGLKS